MFGVPGFSINGDSLISRELFLQDVKLMDPSLDNVSRQAIVFEYSDWADVSNGSTNRDFLAQIVTDNIFICPVQDFGSRYERDIEPSFNLGAQMVSCSVIGYFCIWSNFS